MHSTCSMDLTDRRIVDIMRLEPDITQSELARRLGFSQPSVAARIARLKRDGILVSRVGVNMRKLGLAVGDATLSANDPYKLLSKFESCPCFLYGGTFSGTQNVLLVFAADDVSSLQGIVNQRLRKEPGASEVNFKIIDGLEAVACCPKLCPAKANVSPCGNDCSRCVEYTVGHCVGCPATVHYYGTFWNSERRRLPQVVAAPM
jgi:Lrp/AsnC family leucine-responsive transcriptional regulator